MQLAGPVSEQDHRVPDDAKTFDLPPIEVARGITITGRLVDAEDQPIAGARVEAGDGINLRGLATTDSRGDFTMAGVFPGLTLSYQITVTPQDPQIKAEIVRENPLLLRVPVKTRKTRAEVGDVNGTVVDAEGQPVAGAEVHLSIATDKVGKREILTTDSHGGYHEPHPVVKGTRYRAIISPGKYAVASSETITAEGQDAITLPPITVIRLRTIAGRVVDTDGRPVAGARVLNWGNPAPLTDATTGPTRLLKLGGLAREKSLLFVDAPGYRFHRAATDPGKSTIELVLRRDDQPPAGGVASLGPPITRERAIRLAEAVLKPYSVRILKTGTDPDTRWHMLEVLTRIDPEGAWKKCQAGEAPWACDAVRIAVARHLIAEKPDDAEVIIPTIKNEYWRPRLRMELVDALPSGSANHKLALLDEAADEARQTSSAETRVDHLRRAVQRLIDLGRGDLARRLLDEALPKAKAADAADPGLRHTRGLIGCLARLDLAAARALIPTGSDERTIDDVRGLVAQSIAAQKPEEAERLIDEMSRNRPDTLLVTTCRRMATVDLPRARRIAGRIQNDVLHGYALGRMAEATGAVDRTTARQLRAEAFRAFGRAVERGMGGVWGVPAVSVMASALLPGVERTDPDRLAETLDRVLSLRWHPRSVQDLTMTTPDLSGVDEMRIDATLAAVLARYDHELARSIARPIIERFKKPLSPLEDQHLDRYAILPVLALADPEAAAALVEVIPDLKEGGIGQSRDIARIIVAGALSEPESRFWTIIGRAVFDLEIVDREG